MASVFLSYAREDAPKARALAERLAKAGHSVWWDRHIQGGSNYSDEIETALHQAEVVLVIWSAASVQSSWVRDEAAAGRDSGRLVPLLHDESVPPLGFRQLQSIPISGWSGRGNPPNFDSILEAIAARTSGARPRPAEKPKPTTRSNRRSIMILGGAIVIAILAVGLWFSRDSRWPLSPPRQEVFLAVLPFSDLSPERDKAFFAEGVAEEILSTVASGGHIRVLGRTSARAIEHHPDPKAVRSRLGITHILEGSMRTAGEQFRVNVRLIDTRDGAEIWNQEYRGRMGDVFAVQDQIAARIVDHLHGTIAQLKEGRRARTPAEAYELYLAARALARTRTRPTLSKAMELAKKAVASSPDYAAAHALMAQLYFQLSDDVTSYGTMPVATARTLARPHALEAIRLAPRLADGHASLGLISPPAESVQALTRAVQLDPSRAEPRMWLAISLTKLGRADEALEQAREAAAVEPLWEVPAHIFIQILASSGRYDEALAQVRQFKDRGGSPAQVYRFLAAVARWRGDLSGAVAYSRAALRIDPKIAYIPALLSTDYHLLGLRKESLAILPRELAYTRAARTGKLVESFRLSDAAQVWRAPDGDMAIHAFGARRDWNSLIAIYAAAPADKWALCNDVQWQGPIFALALKTSGRAAEARDLLSCLESRLNLEARNRARIHNPQHPEVSDLEFRRASLLAIKGDRSGALASLRQAADRGWVGRPYSTQLRDYPQFDLLRDDPGFRDLQVRIDARIDRERRELSAMR